MQRQWRRQRSRLALEIGALLEAIRSPEEVSTQWFTHEVRSEKLDTHQEKMQTLSTHHDRLSTYVSNHFHNSQCYCDGYIHSSNYDWHVLI